MKKIYLVAPRGFCAGVERAVKIVNMAIQKFGTPIYIKHEIVHNAHVVNAFKQRGVIFVENIEDVPNLKTVIFSAHGSPAPDYKKAKEKELKVIDATCPLVTKVHIEAKFYAKRGFFIIYIGHKGHPEPIGVLSNVSAKQKIIIETKKEAESLEIKDKKIIILTQTTLSFDDTQEIIKILKRKFPLLILPPALDVCYATQNRQTAVKRLAKIVDLVLVIGSKNSSNSNRLSEVAKRTTPSYLINDETNLENEWFTNVKAVGISSGASAPESIVFKVVEKLKEKGFKQIEHIHVIKEKMNFPLNLAI